MCVRVFGAVDDGPVTKTGGWFEEPGVHELVPASRMAQINILRSMAALCKSQILKEALFQSLSPVGVSSVRSATCLKANGVFRLL